MVGDLYIYKILLMRPIHNTSNGGLDFCFCVESLPPWREKNRRGVAPPIRVRTIGAHCLPELIGMCREPKQGCEHLQCSPQRNGWTPWGLTPGPQNRLLRCLQWSP